MARKEKKYHFIYKTTNLLSGKYYIGMHSTNNLNDGYMGSGRRLKRSLNKYGKENHKVEILEFVNSRSELVAREKEIVNLDEIAKEDCINLMVGGKGGFTDEQQKLNAVRGVEKQRLLRETNPEWVLNKSNNISKALIDVYQKGLRDKVYFYSWSGKKHSEESKKAIGKTNSTKQSGSNNSQYNTCWVTKNGLNRKIKKEDLEDFMNQGWIKGRK